MNDSFDAQQVRVGRLLDGALTPQEHEQFLEELSCHPKLADEVVQSLIVDDLLIKQAEEHYDSALALWLDSCGEKGDTPVRTEQKASRLAKSPRPFFRWPLWISLASVTVVICGALLILSGHNSVAPIRKERSPASPLGSTSTIPAARLTRSVNVEWSRDRHRWSVGDRVYTGETFHLEAGCFELVFDSGAAMTLIGPAELQVRSPLAAELRHGTVTVRAESLKDKEFRILTPLTEVVDLGTEFGVRVEPDRGTDVVVFDGMVDLIPSVQAGESPLPSRRLTVGQAIRMNPSRNWEQIVSVNREGYPFGDGMFQVQANRPPVITGVSDNRRSPSNPMFYQIHHAGLREDAKAYVDRVYEWNGLTREGMPLFLQGADYVSTFNDDKNIDQEPSLITVNVSCPCDLYIFYETRMVVPDWLKEGFEDTGFFLGLDEEVEDRLAVGPGKSINRTCVVWRRRVSSAGAVQLGLIGPEKEPIENDPRPSQRTMFGIAAQPVIDD